MQRWKTVWWVCSVQDGTTWNKTQMTFIVLWLLFMCLCGVQSTTFSWTPQNQKNLCWTSGRGEADPLQLDICSVSVERIHSMRFLSVQISDDPFWTALHRVISVAQKITDRVLSSLEDIGKSRRLCRAGDATHDPSLELWGLDPRGLSRIYLSSSCVGSLQVLLICRTVQKRAHDANVEHKMGMSVWFVECELRPWCELPTCPACNPSSPPRQPASALADPCHLECNRKRIYKINEWINFSTTHTSAHLQRMQLMRASRRRSDRAHGPAQHKLPRCHWKETWTLQKYRRTTCGAKATTLSLWVFESWERAPRTSRSTPMSPH